MKTLYTILCVAVIAFSINARECENELSMFNESVKAKIYDDALPRYAKLIENCPDISIALYVRADKMFEDLAAKTEDEVKKILDSRCNFCMIIKTIQTGNSQYYHYY